MISQIERGADGRYSAYGMRNGRPFVADASESFKRGYGVRYEFEQMMTSRHGR